MKKSLKDAFNFAVNAGFYSGCGAVAGAVSYGLVSACMALSATPLSITFCVLAAICAVDAVAELFLGDLPGKRQETEVPAPKKG